MSEPREQTEQRSWPVRMRVERGKCLELARALRSEAPEYVAADRLVAVPTFPVVTNHWGFSGSQMLQEVGCELTRVLHGSEEFEYPHGPLAEGQELAGAMRLVSRERKQTRGGRGMTALGFELELRDVATGDVAVRVRRTILEMDPAS